MTTDTAADHRTTTTPHPTYVLVSETPRVTRRDCEIMALAITQDQKTFASRWGRIAAVVHAAGAVQDFSYGLTVVRFVEQPSEPDAVAWHSEDADGRIIIEVAVAPVLDHGGGVLDGGTIGESVASAADHEIKEAGVDPSVNLYADRFDGTEVALECADPVQGDLLNITVTYEGQTHRVGLSNYVFPAWFDPQAPSGKQWDAGGTAPGPLQLAPGGYMVLRRVGADLPPQFARTANQTERLSETAHGSRLLVFGPDVPEWKKARARRRVAVRLRGHGHKGPFAKADMQENAHTSPPATPIADTLPAPADSPAVDEATRPLAPNEVMHDGKRMIIPSHAMGIPGAGTAQAGVPEGAGGDPRKPAAVAQAVTRRVDPRQAAREAARTAAVQATRDQIAATAAAQTAPAVVTKPLPVGQVVTDDGVTFAPEAKCPKGCKIAHAHK